MSLTDLLKAKQYKEENDQMKAVLNSEQGQEGMQLAARLQQLREQVQAQERDLLDATRKKADVLDELSELNQQINNKRMEVINLNEDISFQNLGLYHPSYDFANSTQYKEQLDEIRAMEKQCIKDNQAVTGSQDWTVNGNAAKGRKMVKDMQKLLLRAFNSDADEMIAKCKFHNYDKCATKILQSAETTKKLGSMMSISISTKYYNLKMQELRLALDFFMKKEQEKEELRELKAQERENKKVMEQLLQGRANAEKEQQHYMNALEQVNQQLLTAEDTYKEELIKKKEELEGSLEEVDQKMKDLEFREANQRAGYVYVISNIGAFGEDIYKIGMTRRLDPLDRIDELSSASVPFHFDVHALIFSKDAVTLETKLHQAFERKKLNLVNGRNSSMSVLMRLNRR